MRIKVRPRNSPKFPVRSKIHTWSRVVLGLVLVTTGTVTLTWSCPLGWGSCERITVSVVRLLGS